MERQIQIWIQRREGRRRVKCAERGEGRGRRGGGRGRGEGGIEFKGWGESPGAGRL